MLPNVYNMLQIVCNMLQLVYNMLQHVTNCYNIFTTCYEMFTACLQNVSKCLQHVYKMLWVIRGLSGCHPGTCFDIFHFCSVDQQVIFPRSCRGHPGSSGDHPGVIQGSSGGHPGVIRGHGFVFCLLVQLFVLVGPTKTFFPYSCACCFRDKEWRGPKTLKNMILTTPPPSLAHSYPHSGLSE